MSLRLVRITFPLRKKELMETAKTASAPKSLKMMRINCIVPGICAALSGALLIVDMYWHWGDRWNFHLGWTAFFALEVSLVYSACAWSRLTFAMKKRLPWFTGLPFFAATLFPIWSFLWLSLVLVNWFFDDTESIESLTWWAIFALLAAAWLMLAATIVKSILFERRAPLPAPPEANGGVPDAAKVKRWRTTVLVSAFAALLLMALGLGWLKCFLVYVIPRLDWRGKDFFDMWRKHKMMVIWTSVALTLILTWTLYAWNRLMLEARRHFIVHFFCDLAAVGFFSTAFCLVIFNTHSFVPLLPFAGGTAVMTVDALLTFRIGSDGNSPNGGKSEN